MHRVGILLGCAVAATAYELDLAEGTIAANSALHWKLNLIAESILTRVVLVVKPGSGCTPYGTAVKINGFYIYSQGADDVVYQPPVQRYLAGQFDLVVENTNTCEPTVTPKVVFQYVTPSPSAPTSTLPFNGCPQFVGNAKLEALSCSTPRDTWTVYVPEGEWFDLCVPSFGPGYRNSKAFIRGCTGDTFRVWISGGAFEREEPYVLNCSDEACPQGPLWPLRIPCKKQPCSTDSHADSHSHEDTSPSNVAGLVGAVGAASFLCGAAVVAGVVYFMKRQADVSRREDRPLADLAHPIPVVN